MPQTNNNINYTSEDLLRYARGQMSPQQMHALEKAALEDVFLAEALDGYMEANSYTQTVPGLLEEKLASFKLRISAPQPKEEQPKVVPIWRQKWLQYAVAASVVLVAGWWALLVNKPEAPKQIQTIAQNEPAQFTAADSTLASGNGSVSGPLDYKKEAETNSIVPQKDYAVGPAKKEKAVAGPGLATIDAVKPGSATTIEQNEIKGEEHLIEKKATNDAIPSKSATPAAVLKDQATNQMASGKASNSNNQVVRAEGSANNFNDTRRYTFNGKVVDANNNPLPYSNVMIPGEGVGTYSDAKGNFNFVYVDSTLPVRARSLGYEEKNYTMQPDVKENRIVLREDEELKRKMVVNRQEKQAPNRQYMPMIVEKDSLISAEPSVGWYDYNIYALNNIRGIELPGKRSVQLSFDVNKDGDVENITVEKSSGKELDDEAIRLLKEGPKWKSKKGNSRAKVTLKF
ncbi:MAG: TonB family protein [Chitinophagaceae bacterium]